MNYSGIWNTLEVGYVIFMSNTHSTENFEWFRDKLHANLEIEKFLHLCTFFFWCAHCTHDSDKNIHFFPHIWHAVAQYFHFLQHYGICTWCKEEEERGVTRQAWLDECWQPHCLQHLGDLAIYTVLAHEQSMENRRNGITKAWFASFVNQHL